MKKRHQNHTFLIHLVLCAALALIIALASRRISQDTRVQEQRGIEAAMEKDITSCYALEGAYPPDLQYLKDHYGLVYDESAFFVDYRPIAANIRPDYTVIAVHE